MDEEDRRHVAEGRKSDPFLTPRVWLHVFRGSGLMLERERVSIPPVRRGKRQFVRFAL